jgi:uncharacterized membrane protein YfcA
MGTYSAQLAVFVLSISGCLIGAQWATRMKDRRKVRRTVDALVGLAGVLHRTYRGSRRGRRSVRNV